MNEMLNDEILENVTGGAGETEYKYRVEFANWVHCGPDGHDVWVVQETVSTNDPNYEVKIKKSGSGCHTVVYGNEPIFTKSIKRLYDLCEDYGGNLIGLR